METIKFKTTIKCSGCVAQATPFLNEIAGEQNWNVDTTDPLKVLSVSGVKDPEKIVEAVKRAGYQAEIIS